jgi:hypothetical protein
MQEPLAQSADSAASRFFLTRQSLLELAQMVERAAEQAGRIPQVWLVPQ